MNKKYNRYSEYIKLYGQFSHILTIKLDKNLSDDEKEQVLLDIYELLHNNIILKHISNTIVGLKWRTIDLHHYYTGGDGMFGDTAIHEHTKLLLNDINDITNSDKINISLSKPLIKEICLM